MAQLVIPASNSDEIVFKKVSEYFSLYPFILYMPGYGKKYLKSKCYELWNLYYSVSCHNQRLAEIPGVKRESDPDFLSPLSDSNAIQTRQLQSWVDDSNGPCITNVLHTVKKLGWGLLWC